MRSRRDAFLILFFNILFYTLPPIVCRERLAWPGTTLRDVADYSVDAEVTTGLELPVLTLLGLALTVRITCHFTKRSVSQCQSVKGIRLGEITSEGFVICENGRIQPEDQLPLPVLGVPVHPHPHHQLHHPVDHVQYTVWNGGGCFVLLGYRQIKVNSQTES